MKLILILYFSTICLFSLGQSKKSILKDINNFKYQTHSSALFPTSTDTLKWIVYDYCEREKYEFLKEDNGYLEFSKKIYAPHTKNQLIESYVYIDILPRGLLKLIKVDTKEVVHETPFFIDGKQINKNTITHDFDKREFYEYVFKHFNKDPLILPDELSEKIEKYNAKQTKADKKIIAGRDY